MGHIVNFFETSTQKNRRKICPNECQRVCLISRKYMGTILGQNLVNGWVNSHFPTSTSLPKILEYILFSSRVSSPRSYYYSLMNCVRFWVQLLNLIQTTLFCVHVYNPPSHQVRCWWLSYVTSETWMNPVTRISSKKARFWSSQAMYPPGSSTSGASGSSIYRRPGWRSTKRRNP